MPPNMAMAQVRAMESRKNRTAPTHYAHAKKKKSIEKEGNNTPAGFRPFDAVKSIMEIAQ